MINALTFICLAVATLPIRGSVASIQMFKSSHLVRPVASFQDSRPHYVPICLYTPSYVEADLVKEEDRQRFKLVEPTESFVEGSGIEVPKEGSISIVANTSLSAFENSDKHVIGHSIDTIMNISISSTNFRDIKMKALVHKPNNNLPLEQSIHLGDLLNSLSIWSPEPVHSALLKSPFTIEFVGGKPASHSLASLSKKKDLHGVYVNGKQMLEEAPDDYYILIAKDYLTFAYPTVEKIAAVLNSPHQCWLEQQQIICDWSDSYNPIQYTIGKENYTIEQEQYIENCYYSVQRKGMVCATRISVCPGGHNYIGWPFLRKYPIEIYKDMTHRIISQRQNKGQFERAGIVKSVFEHNLRLSAVHRWIILSFFCLLVVLKGYHVYFKSLPRSSYSDFDSIVADANNNSVSSTQSEGDDTDKDHFNDLSS